MVGVVLAFVSSLLWGASDFTGGVSSRKSTALHATLWSFVSATAVCGVVAAAWASPASSVAIIAGIVAGICGLGGFLALYASLATAPMGVVTVIVGAVEAIIPVVVGVAWLKESLSPLAWVGVAVAMIGAGLLGLAEGGAGKASIGPLILAAASGAFFGLSVVALDYAPEDSGINVAAIELAVGLVLLVVLAALVARSDAVRRVSHTIGIAAGPIVRGSRATVIALIAGVFLAAANITLLLALREGQLAVVGVVLCLYPVTTAVLARFILGERLTWKHIGAIAIALGGCVLLAVA